MRRRYLLVIVLVVFAVASGGVAWANASANYAIQPSLVAAGGRVASSANYSIMSSVGQPAIGQVVSASYSLCSGFWCGAQAALEKLFLPLVRR